MKQEITKALADGTALAAVSGGIATKFGWFKFINEYAEALGFIATCIFGLVATVFYFLTYSKAQLSERNKKGLQVLKTAFDDHKTDTDKSFKKVDEGINEIKELLNNKVR